MDRKNDEKTLRHLGDEDLSTVSGGNLAMAGKTGQILMSYYDNKAAGNDGVAAFLSGVLKGAGTPVPKHHT
jgi:hypothetical protein